MGLVNFKKWLEYQLQYPESFRGWIAPNGQRIAIDGGRDHHSVASDLLDKYYPNWEWWENPEFQEGGAAMGGTALESKGWIRVVAHGEEGLYSVYDLHHSRTKLLELLDELEPNATVLIAATTTNRRVPNKAKDAIGFLKML